jgi:hypothetical protein
MQIRRHLMSMNGGQQAWGQLLIYQGHYHTGFCVLVTEERAVTLPASASTPAKGRRITALGLREKLLSNGHRYIY